MSKSIDYISSMQKKTSKNKEQTTITLIVLLSSLLTFGIINLYSASINIHFFNSQLKHIALSLLIFWFTGWHLSIQTVNSCSYVIFFINIILLAAVLLLGHKAGGAQRWLAIGPIKFQPSEFAKLSCILITAKFFYNNHNRPEYSLSELWPIIISNLVIFILIFKQPDFGTAGVCSLIFFSQLAFIKIKIQRNTLIFLILLCFLVVIFGWNIFLHPYQKMHYDTTNLILIQWDLI